MQKKDAKIDERFASLNSDQTFTEKSDLMNRWSASCALCHTTGVGNAPKVGDKDAWKARIKKGKTTLIKNTVKGFKQMPPLGYCMSCDEADFVAMIEFMAGESIGDVK